MKLYKLLSLLLVVLLMGACDEESGDGDGNEVTDPVAPVIAASIDGMSIVAAEENLATELTITWDAADFGLQVAVAYELQMDLDGGTFANPVVLASGITDATVTITYGALNTAAITELGQAANAETVVDLRIVATSTGLDDLISAVVGVSLTTYEGEVVVEPEYANIWVAGAFQGWDATNFISLTSAADNGVYEGYLYLPEGQGEFKLYQNQNDWGPDSWGTDNDGTGAIYVANEACCNFMVDAEGMYWVEVDVPNLTYKLELISWGVIGDATPTGWDADTDLVYNADTQALEVTLDLTAVGSYKFRANDAWAHAMGIDGEGNLVYSDHITNGFTEGINNITVAEDGNYTISLDLHNSNTYTYSVVKN